jgi:CDP-diacylglycerol--serine O-phosphatidyltransferase
MVKANILGFIPNLLTLASLFCGCVGVVWAFNHQIDWAVYMIWTSAVLDVLDGLVARALGVSSALGKQLDSLADLVAFGLLPAVILYILSTEYQTAPWPFMAFFITVFSALRLARFNLDKDQDTNFKGLPTPANALFISSFPALISHNSAFLRLGLENRLFWLLIVGILSYLLVSRIPLLGLKFSNYSWAGNKHRYVLIVLAVTLGLSLGVLAIPWIILTYLVISMVWRYGNA